MYVQRYILARSREHFCHGNATIRSIFVVGIDIAVNNLEVLIVIMEMQQWALFALLSYCC